MEKVTRMNDQIRFDFEGLIDDEFKTIVKILFSEIDAVGPYFVQVIKSEVGIWKVYYFQKLFLLFG